MYFPATRVLTVLELLQSRQRISGPELATRLEVDTRTVRRYIMMLQDLGVPVEAERGRYGSYRLRPGFKLPPLMFTDDEALALTLGLLAARKMGLAVAAPAVEGALAKIERVLPTRVQAVEETLVFDFTPSSAVPNNEVVVTLCAASQQGRRVEMCYRNWNSSEETRRTVDPYGLVFRSGFWYMVGYCHLRADLRTFRLDRIVSTEMNEESFTRPPDFDCLAHLLQSLPRTPNTWYVDVRLETTLEHARRVVPPALAILEEDEGGVNFRCYVDNLDWIAYVLLGLGCPLVVRQPAELRDALRRLAHEATKLAERTLEYHSANC